MDSTPPSGNSSPGLRTLAAIIFTDVVGFSARMQQDEVGTLKLLQRDFAEMRRLAAAHGGTVLKTTGDGLLLTFSSAVHAVACALEMQRQFAEVVKAKPNALQHRLGIHLGDILFQDQDVMGDGVNIASRLQAEADPGGICISQTVYDVVKNKLEMRAVSLGPRELKNITQAVPVYRILLEAQALTAGSASPTVPPSAPARDASASPTRSRSGLWIGLGVGLLAAAAAVAFFLTRPVDPVSPASSAAAPTPPGSATPVAAAAATVEISDADFARELARRQAQTQQMRAQFLETYDFAGFARALREGGEGTQGRAANDALLKSVDAMVSMKDWLEFGLARYRPQQPLPVADLSGDPARNFSVFPVVGGRIVIVDATSPHPPIPWSELKPPVMGAIILSSIRTIRQPAATRENILGAQAFARFFNLPNMLEQVNAILRAPAGRQGQPGPNPARQGATTPARQGAAGRAGRQ